MYETYKLGKHYEHNVHISLCQKSDSIISQEARGPKIRTH